MLFGLSTSNHFSYLSHPFFSPAYALVSRGRKFRDLSQEKSVQIATAQNTNVCQDELSTAQSKLS